MGRIYCFPVSFQSNFACLSLPVTTPLFPITLAFCLGIAISHRISTAIPVLAMVTFFFLLASWLFVIRRKIAISFWMSIGAFLTLGMSWPPLYEAGYHPNHLKSLVEKGKIDLREPCRIVGICAKSSIQRGIGEQIELEVSRLQNGFQSFSTQGRVRLALYYHKGEAPPLFPVLKAGDLVEVLVNLRRPRNFNNPGQFDYASYLERQGVFLVGTIKNELLITKLASRQGSWRLRATRGLKGLLFRTLDQALVTSPDIKSSLKALLLGEKQGLSPQLEEAFQATGIYHVLVISGQHVAIMAGFLFALFRLFRFPLPFAALLTMAGLATYGAIVEGQSSIVRAIVMTYVFLLVLILDRDRNLLNSVALAGLALLLVDPFWLFDAGFQLSFAAVLAIALLGLPLLHRLTQPYKKALWQIDQSSFDARFSPRLADFRIALRLKIEALRQFWKFKAIDLPKRMIVLPLCVLLWLVDIFLISLAIQAVFSVLMILYFHRVSLLSPLVNLLVVPLVGVIVPLGFFFFFCSLFLPAIGSLLIKTCSILVGWLLKLATLFANDSWGNYRIATPPQWLVILYLSSLGLFLVSRKKAYRLIWSSTASVSLLMLLVQPFGPTKAGRDLQVTFLDVRQGDCIFLRFPDASTMLIDGGGLLGRSFGEDFSEETFDVGEKVVSPFLWSQRIMSLDTVVLTHAHHDHMSGLHAILKNFPVKELWIGKNPMTPEYMRFLKTAVRKAVIVRSFSSGDEVDCHGSLIDFLNPDKGHIPSPAPSNNDSLVFTLQYGSRSFLLTGDIEKKIEARIIDRAWDIHADTLKVAHHGSRSSTTTEFLATINPVLAVISVAEHSPFGHPHDDVLERLKQKPVQVFRTDQNGAITIFTDGNQLRVQTFLD